MKHKIINFLKNPDSFIWHIVFWSMYLLLYAGIRADGQTNASVGMSQILVTFPVKLITSYFFMYWVLPKTMKNNSYRFFFTCLIISIPITVFIDGFISVRFVYSKLSTSCSQEAYWSLSRAFKIFVRLYGVVFTTIALRYVYLQFLEQKKMQQIKNEHLAIEMKYLKNQINPHFLFNTLNSLYSLIINNKKQAGEVVLKLSEIMRYMIYDASHTIISIEKEIELLQNYIALEKTRFGNRISVSFNILGKPNNLKIPALICLPLVENSFKHSMSDGVGEVFITIDLTIKETEICLIVENTKPKMQKEKKVGGFGLQNLKRRMDLLFNTNYVFKVKEDADSYLTILKFDTMQLINRS